MAQAADVPVAATCTATVAYQGNAVLASALGEPERLACQACRLNKWIDSLQA
jgi:hypothetical protein